MADVYVDGYVQAARYLGRALMRSRGPRRLSLDACIYPLLFLWRHYLELRLKDLIVSLSGLADQTPRRLTDIHDLGKLWGLLRPLLDARAILAEDLRRADQIFQEFAKVDPKSQAFRYQEDKQGKASAAGVSQVNVPRLHAAMEYVSELLEGMSALASIELDQRIEMEQSYWESAE